MAYTVKHFQSTPNPNALKCILDRPIAARPLSFRSPPPAPEQPDPALPEARTDADRLAPALFAIPGVVGLLFNADWLTVNKAQDAQWATIKPAVKRALASE